MGHAIAALLCGSASLLEGMTCRHSGTYADSSAHLSRCRRLTQRKRTDLFGDVKAQPGG